MNPDHDKLVARIQHFYDVLRNHQKEASDTAIMERDEKVKNCCCIESSLYSKLAVEYEGVFSGMLYTEKL